MSGILTNIKAALAAVGAGILVALADNYLLGPAVWQIAFGVLAYYVSLFILENIEP